MGTTSKGIRYIDPTQPIRRVAEYQKYMADDVTGLLEDLPAGPAGPPGPAGGSDAAFASWITDPGSLTGDAIGVKVTDLVESSALPDLVDTKIADAAEVQLAGLELGYSEKLVNSTSTATASPGTILSGLGVAVVGKGRPVDVEFQALAGWHSVANTTFVVVLIINGVPFLAAIGSSSSTATGRSVNFKRRLVLVDGTNYTFVIGLYGAAAGTTTLQAISTSPTFLTVTSR